VLSPATSFCVLCSCHTSFQQKATTL